MAKAFVCDATGAVVSDAEPVRVFEATVAGVDLVVRGYVKVDPKTRREADLSAAWAEKVKAAMASLEKKGGKGA